MAQFARRDAFGVVAGMAPLPPPLPLLPAWLLWPLRKAALIPAIALTMGSIAASVGAINATTRLLHVFVRVPPTGDGKRRRGTDVMALTAAASTATGVTAFRELFLRPRAPAAVALPIDNVSFVTRLANAGHAMAHYLFHWPYRFRFYSILHAGCSAAVAFVATERMMNPPIAAAAPLPLLRDAEGEEDELH